MPQTKAGKIFERKVIKVLESLGLGFKIRTKGVILQGWRSRFINQRVRRRFADVELQFDTKRLVIECRRSGGGSFDGPKALDTVILCRNNQVSFLVVCEGVGKLSTDELRSFYDDARAQIDDTLPLTTTSVDELEKFIRMFFT